MRSTKRALVGQSEYISERSLQQRKAFTVVSTISKTLREPLLLLVLVYLSILLWTLPSFSVTPAISYQGRILKPDQTPLVAESVEFQLKINVSGKNCTLYSESQVTEMTSGDGSFHLLLGKGRQLNQDSNIVFSQIFSPQLKIPKGTPGCADGFTKTPADELKLQIGFSENGNSHSLNPMEITTSPMAFDTWNVGGVNSANVLRASEGPIEPLSPASYTDFLSLLNGTSSKYAPQNDKFSVDSNGNISFAGSLLPSTPSQISQASRQTLTSIVNQSTSYGRRWNALASDGVLSFLFFQNSRKSLLLGRCSDSSCQSTTSLEIATQTSAISSASLLLTKNNIPFVAYQWGTELHLIQCLDINCENRNDTIVATPENTSVTGLNLALGSDDLVRITYFDYTYSAPNYSTKKQMFVRCLDGACSGKVKQTLDSTYGGVADLVIGASGATFVAYTYNASPYWNGLRLTACSDSDCASTSAFTIDEKDISRSFSLALGADGFPRIAYTRISSGALEYRSCTSMDCSVATTTVLDPQGGTGAVSIQTDSQGLSRILYGTGGEKYIQCTNSACSTYLRSTLPGSANLSSLHLSSSGAPLIFQSVGSASSYSFVATQLASPSGQSVTSGTSIGTMSTPYGSGYFEAINSKDLVTQEVQSQKVVSSLLQSSDGLFTNRVGIGTNAPSASLDVNGLIKGLPSARIYVDYNAADDSGDGLTAQTAKKTLCAAINLGSTLTNTVIDISVSNTTSTNRVLLGGGCTISGKAVAIRSDIWGAGRTVYLDWNGTVTAQNASIYGSYNGENRLDILLNSTIMFVASGHFYYELANSLLTFNVNNATFLRSRYVTTNSRAYLNISHSGRIIQAAGITGSSLHYRIYTSNVLTVALDGYGSLDAGINTDGVFFDSKIWTKANGAVGIGTASPSNTLSVAGNIDVSGKVGIGTTTPSYSLEITGATTNFFRTIRDGGSSNWSQVGYSPGAWGPAIIFNRAMGSQATPAPVQNGYYLFNIYGGGYDGVGFYYGTEISSMPEETWSTSGHGAGLQFKTTPNGTTGNPTTRMTITNSGNVDIGTTTPAYKLDVAGDINTSTCFRVGATTIGGTCTSDVRLKDNIHDYGAGLNELLGIRVRTYQFNGLGEIPKNGEIAVGVIAQEVEKTNPDLVKNRLIKLHPDDKEQTEIKVVDYSKFTYMLINAVKQLYHSFLTAQDQQATHSYKITQLETSKADKSEIESLREKNSELQAHTERVETENRELRARVEKIEKLLEGK